MVIEEGYEEKWNEGDEWNDSHEGYWAEDQNWNEGYLAFEDLYYLDEYGEENQDRGQAAGHPEGEKRSTYLCRSVA
jgi:hypothetical protein